MRKIKSDNRKKMKSSLVSRQFLQMQGGHFSLRVTGTPAINIGRRFFPLRGL